MLTVYCVLWGDKYPHEYVRRLARGVYRNLSIAHHFVCITDQDVAGVICRPPSVPYPGWWQKIGLFEPGLNHGPALYIDLDCVITGSLDALVEAHTLGGLHMTRNWSASAHGGFQSSVMLWRDDAGAEIYRTFDYDLDAPRLWGDQEYITELMRDQIHEIPPGPVASYKYHCQNGLPSAARIVCFHGKPDYHECGDPWILQYIQTSS